MSQSVQNLSAARLREAHGEPGERLVDLRVQWVDWTGERVLLDCGGVWDRKLEDYVADGDTAQIARLQPGQYAAAKWFSGWLAAYLAGGDRPPEFDRKWSMFLLGGRRGGKSDFAIKAVSAFAAARRERQIWLISPTEKETNELQEALEQHLPAHWYHYAEAKLEYTLANYTKIRLLSGYKPSSLKQGRVDLWLLNEAQEIAKSAFTKLRAPLADTGGLGLVAANPPDRPIGQWLLDSYDQLKAGKSTSVLFEFDPRKNPAIDHRALEDMADDVGEQDYKRDVLGEFLPIGDLVWYGYSPRDSVSPMPAIGDVTRAFTKRHLGHEFDDVFGIDLQLVPHMAAAGARFFHDAQDPSDPLTWFHDEVVVEGDEDDLLDELEAKGYTSDTTALVIDASAWWQDAARTKGRGSIDIFRRRGWRWCFKPDARADKNPHIFERVQATNARLKSAAGRRRVFFDPECIATCEAMRRWENRNGIPYRRSPFAHRSDAVSYLINRFFPRRLVTKFAVEKVTRKRSAREKELDRL